MQAIDSISLSRGVCHSSNGDPGTHVRMRTQWSGKTYRRLNQQALGTCRLCRHRTPRGASGEFVSSGSSLEQIWWCLCSCSIHSNLKKYPQMIKRVRQNIELFIQKMNEQSGRIDRDEIKRTRDKWKLITETSHIPTSIIRNISQDVLLTLERNWGSIDQYFLKSSSPACMQFQSEKWALCFDKWWEMRPDCPSTHKKCGALDSGDLGDRSLGCGYVSS